MAKEINKKSNRVGNREKKISHQEWEKAQRLLEKGETLGDSIICMMPIMANDWKGLGVVTVGLARAWAFLKHVAEPMGVDVEKLFNDELAVYEQEFGELRDEDDED